MLKKQMERIFGSNPRYNLRGYWSKHMEHIKMIFSSNTRNKIMEMIFDLNTRNKWR